MPHTNTRNRKPAVAVVVALLLACLGLAACGSSSSTTSSSANAASTGTSASTGTASGTSSTGSTSTTPGGQAAGRGAGRFTAMRECLQKNGITLPKRTPGSRPGAGGFPGAGAGSEPQLPSGVTHAQYEAALKKCGVHFFRGGNTRRLNNPVFKSALTKYATCLRQSGINVPAPNTSGNGPIFNTKGINTKSSRFKAASATCRAILLNSFKSLPRAHGAPGAPPAGGAPTGSQGAAAGGESGIS